jgi:hypothetical protein
LARRAITSGVFTHVLPSGVDTTHVSVTWSGVRAALLLLLRQARTPAFGSCAHAAKVCSRLNTALSSVQ